MANVDLLLSRLQGVRNTGRDTWMARCPAHADKSPSLKITYAGNGLVLAHCFAGCEVQAVLEAVDLTFEDLFPDRLPVNHPGRRPPFFPSDVFDIARREIGVAAVIAAELHKQRTVSESDYERLFKAVERLNGIAQAAYER
jgi:hypothetical protein